MSGQLRSKKGCWTCRLRRKKCDEARPQCETCVSLSIPCYGYGPKPDWMGSGEKEKDVVNGLKEIVKRTWRNKSSTKTPVPRDSKVPLAPKSVEGATSNSPAEHSDQSNPAARGNEVSTSSDYTSLQDTSSARNTVSNVTSPESNDDQFTNYAPTVSGEDSLLLMHFLDFVLPVQYPMYRPQPVDGGRGWFLALLLRTKPLYHAAMALSAYHHRSVVVAVLRNHQCKNVGIIHQEKQLESSLIELQHSMRTVGQFVTRLCPNDGGLGIIASMLQLVFFELFAREGTTWRVHLKASTDMYHRILNERLAHLGLTETAETIINNGLPDYNERPIIRDEVIAFRFFSGTVFWLDIVSSITAGTAPKMLVHHSLIADSDNIDLEKIMGCKNWVMVKLGQIASLHERKTQSQDQGMFDYSEFMTEIYALRKDLEAYIAQAQLEGLCFNDGQSCVSFDPAKPSSLVTRAFAYMALVYLHLVGHGFEDIDVVESTSNEAIQFLQTNLTAQVLPALVCPMFVIACVACEHNKQYFRSAFSHLTQLEASFGHRGMIGPVLEDVWKRRCSTPGFNWSNIVEVTRDLLLI